MQGTSDSKLACELGVSRTTKTSRRGALCDNVDKTAAGDASPGLASYMRTPSHVPYTIGSSQQGKPGAAAPASPPSCPSDHMNMLSFPAVSSAAVSGTTSTVPLLAGGNTTEGSVSETELFGRGTGWGGADAASSALLMQSRSIESNLSQYTRPVTGASADIAAATLPRMLSDSIRGSSLPASAQSALPAEAVDFHRRLFHPATQLGTLDHSNAFQTLARTVGGNPAQDPGEHATSAQRLDYIASQLDSLGRQAVVLQKYELLGRDERRRGGAGPLHGPF